jgi:hypothetical protein
MRIISTFAALIAATTSAVAFNPQPEPPANQWSVQGFIDMTSLTSEQTGAALPFGVPGSIIGDDQVDFRVGVIATFTAPAGPFGGTPADGLYTPILEYFQVQIGDTTWDETMLTPGDLEFQVAGGLVTGVGAVVTDTMPSHPDLLFSLPTSPGTWLAIDERDGTNLGTLSGEYALRNSAVVPEPSAFLYGLLLCTGLAVRYRFGR